MRRTVVFPLLVILLASCQTAEKSSEEIACDALDDILEAFFEPDFDRYVAETTALRVEAGRAEDRTLRDIGTTLFDAAALWAEADFADDDLFRLNLNGVDLLNERCLQLGY